MRTFFTLLLAVVACHIHAQVADTLIVQTFTHAAQNNPNTAYDYPGRRWFDFPASNNGTSYQKILMYYNLKCFEQGTAGNLGFPCGEWDYLSYTYLYQHTGLFDSTLTTHPHYLLGGQDFDSVQITDEPQFNLQQWPTTSSVLDMQEESYVQTDTLNTFGNGPLTNLPQGRHQYIYRSEELSASGLAAGDLVQISLNSLVDGPVNYSQLQVKGQWTTSNTLEQWSNAAWIDLYAASTNLDESGWLNFNFSSPLAWDGVSNLLLEISYQNTDAMSSPLMATVEKDYHCHVSAQGRDRYITFDGDDRIDLPSAAFASIDDEITIAFWIFGDTEIQPADGTVFEGIGSSNERIVNVHLPWSNGRVYWDAGHDGGYDRIDKAANANNYEGQWNHWAFTKNASTGQMKMYLNGVLWHSGSNLDNTMEEILHFSLGAARSWSNYYAGSIDEFAIWNTALDEPTIAAWMNRDLNDTHPAWDQLQVYYSFDGPSSVIIPDDSGNEHHGVVAGNPQRNDYAADELWRNATVDSIRPVLRFFTGVASIVNTDTFETLPVEIPPTSWTTYAIQNHAPVVVDATAVWTQAYTYLLDVDGNVIDSASVLLDVTVSNDTLSYFQAPFEIINRFELNRFITMYGIGLDLGDNGWTWITDVTDFAPLLRDSVELEAGNWQELLDLKFVFIEGTPAQDVLRVERVWDGNYALNTFDEQVVAKEITKQEGEVAWKLLTTNTGHGFGFDNNNCGEFCNNMQTVKVNGTTLSTWDILQECADNPLYPQGGTWVYDRAGWCPGMNSTTKEFDLTQSAGNEATFDIDYDITQDPYGNYVFFGTLIGYGPKNHLHDPEIDQILAPSAQLIHSRWNPICDNPRFVLRNKGAMPLTDVNIVYGVEGGEPQSFHWIGNLEFMESEEVELTSNDALMWSGDDEEVLTFYITLTLSSDGVDENGTNNHAESTFLRPPTYQYTNLDDNRLIIQLKTNASNLESSYTLYDRMGNVVFERSGFAAPNTTYRDTLELNAGCYMFHLRDAGDDGLSFFANDDGNGNCKLDRISGLDFINFENNFGKEIIHYFNWNTDLVSVDDTPKDDLRVHLYPNPNNAYAMIRTTGMDHQLDVRIVDVTGQLVYAASFNKRYDSDEIRINTDSLADGWYQVWVSDGQRVAQVPMIHMRP
jgi:hypothetical protein